MSPIQKRRSLAAKFNLLTIMLILVTAAAICLFVIGQEKAHYYRDLVDHGKAIADMLSRNVEYGVYTESQAALTPVIDSLFVDPAIASVSVMDARFQILASRSFMDRNDLPQPSPTVAGIGEIVHHDLVDGRTGRQYIEVLCPVRGAAGGDVESDIFEGKTERQQVVIGYVRLILTQEGMQKAMGDLFLRIALFTSMLVLVGIGLTVLLTRKITSPLKQLTTATQKIADGRFDESAVIPDSRDEISDLARAFENMRDRLRSSHIQVEERTTALIEANEKLHDEISAREAVEEQLRHAQKLEAVGTLAGGVAHDFNNILTAIIGFGTLLKMKMNDDSAPVKYVDQILRSAERAAMLTQSLLAFSRKNVINLQPLPLNEVVKRVEDLLLRLIGEDIVVSLSLSDEPMIVRADAGQIEQILMNLATNARDAMPGGGKLTIETAVSTIDNDFIHAHGYGQAGDYAVLSVSDTGVGMDEKTRNRIFEPFFSTKEVGKGTGLGLSIIYGIIKQHEGYVNVVSKPGQGTTFSIYLPLASAAADDAKPDEHEILPEGGNATILVIEDDESVRAFTQTVLEGFGYRVITARDGDDGLEKFEEYKDQIDMLILDIIMPKKNGKEVYDEIRKKYPRVKALFTSGYSSDIISAKCIIENSLHFIAKPISPRDLFKKVNEILSTV